MEHNHLQYYRLPGIMTDPKEQASLFAGLPTGTAALCAVVQGLLLHIFWAERYGVHLTADRKEEVNIRTAADKLARIQALCNQPLTVARPLDQRLVANCRDFTVLLCTLLRHQGVPARARSGFATYFLPGHYEDHWVCEVWNAAEGRWVLVDAQLDTLQCDVLGISFDPLDVPRDRFLVGGQAWQICRAGQADPASFGIFDMHGLWFIRGDLVRDFLALNKVEILPWDGWGTLITGDDTLPAQELAWFDHLAALTLAGDDQFAAVRDLYESDDHWRPPPAWLPAGMPALW